MNLHQIQYFKEIANCGTFSKAASKLFIAQPTLSQQISLLEEELGVSLFNRLPRSAELTLAGKHFLVHADKILNEISVAKAEMKEMSNVGLHTFKFGIIWSLSTLGYANLLNEFMIHAKDLSVSLVTDSSLTIQTMIASNELDGGITLIDLDHPPVGISYPLLLDSQSMVIGMRKDCPLSQKKEIYPSDLQPYPIIPMGRYSICYDHLMYELKQTKLNYNVVCECPSFITACQMTASDMGICIVTLSNKHVGDTIDGIIFRPLVTKKPYRFELAFLTNSHPSNAAISLLNLYKKKNPINY